ncbi:MAG TPA: VOC family protein [Thermoanaerobaculia bacterium]|nr:VOC family protein [Thermoanaerobaculia bacterium]
MRATVSHFEIPARDMERAARFYRDVFGWEIEPLPWEGHPYYKVRGVAGEALGGGIVPAGEGYEHPLLVIHATGELDAWIERIVDEGGTVEQPPAPVGDFGWFARFRDTEGNVLGLWGRPGAEAPGP